jgi:hypothetical protein
VYLKLNYKLLIKKHHRKHILFLIIPLALSSITHLLFPIGFPGLHYDEGIYMRRSMYLLEGQGPQDPSNRFDHTQESTSAYDHPYFGEMLLGSILSLIGYPDTVISPNTLDSIQMLYLVPRFLMGILAVFDTFLVYKITETRYNDKAAFIASTLFAIMPLTWLLRRIVLDSLMLPLLLMSILFAVYYDKRAVKNLSKDNTSTLTILLSGLFLGLAIFTKTPAVIVIPVIVYLIVKANTFGAKNNLKALVLWFLPVILTALIWPIYSMSVGQFDQWLDGVLWQTSAREERGLFFAFDIILDIDPVLFILGIAGLTFAAIKKDFTFILWLFPFFILIYLVGWVTHFHWIIVFPALCIAASVLLSNILNKVTSSGQKVVFFASVIALFIFGLSVTFLTITTNVSSHQFEAAAFMVDLTNANISDNIGNKDSINTTIISSPMYSWLFKYVIREPSVLSWFRDTSTPIHTDRFVLAVDVFYKNWIKASPPKEDKKQIEKIKRIYNNTSPKEVFSPSEIKYDRTTYPYTSIGQGRIGASEVEIRGNY